jgi:hypothetical protein
VALIGLYEYLKANNAYPGNNADNVAKVKELGLAALKAAGEGAMEIEIEDPVFEKAVKYAECSISPMAAFFGGIVA